MSFLFGVVLATMSAVSYSVVPWAERKAYECTMELLSMAADAIIEFVQRRDQ